MRKYLNMTVIASVILENTQVNTLGSSEYGPCNRIIEVKIGLKEIKNRSTDKLILGHLNISSLRNKFGSLKNTVGRKIDIEQQNMGPPGALLNPS